MPERRNLQPGSWLESLLGIVPIVLFGLAVIVREAGSSAFMSGFITNSIFYAILVTMAAIAWFKGSPRWSYPYTGFLLLFTWYRQAFETPVMRIFGSTIPAPGELWGWRAWVPLLVTVGIVLLAARSWEPLAAFFRNIWQDWTLFPFAFYGMATLLFWWFFDEMHAQGLIVISLSAITLLLLAGALGYLRSAAPQRRIAALLAGLLPAWLIVILVPAFYWHGRRVPYLPEPINGYDQIIPGLNFAGVILLVMFFPGLYHFTISRLKTRQA